MNTASADIPTCTPVEITDEEHTLILMMRTMRLNEIMCVMNLNKFFPQELPHKYQHIRNIISLHFGKSYEVHTVRTIIEFMSTQPLFDAMFQQYSIREMIDKYSANNIAESANAHELYLQPYTTTCIECQTSLKPVYAHRSKTVMSLTRTYRAQFSLTVIATCYCATCDIEIFPNFYIQKNNKFVTLESIKNDKFIYLNGNQIFDQNLLIDFDQNLIQNTVSFEGYTNAYNSKIELINRRLGHNAATVNGGCISLLNEKNFQMVWLFINIAKFKFMTTNDKIVQIPMSVRDIDECNPYFLLIKNDLYKNFVVFWTNHQRFTKKCNPETCSKIFVVDGHQKANRLVCQYKNVFDCTIPELGPIQMGCLYSPLRRAPGIDHRYCQHHQPATLEENDRMTHMTPEIINEDKEQVLDKLALINVKCKIKLPCSEGIISKKHAQENAAVDDEGLVLGQSNSSNDSSNGSSNVLSKKISANTASKRAYSPSATPSKSNTDIVKKKKILSTSRMNLSEEGSTQDVI
ncbi:hypothetical protein I4U23_011020 [Adineta vaga]|nr:hypothetical protein I4U23_011020 [Adineta vaga]